MIVSTSCVHQLSVKDPKHVYRRETIQLIDYWDEESIQDRLVGRREHSR